MDDEYITEVNAFFQPELSRFAPHFNNGELRPAPMVELYGPGAEAVRLNPAAYKEFIERWRTRTSYTQAGVQAGGRSCQPIAATTSAVEPSSSNDASLPTASVTISVASPPSRRLSE